MENGDETVESGGETVENGGGTVESETVKIKRRGRGCLNVLCGFCGWQPLL